MIQYRGNAKRKATIATTIAENHLYIFSLEEL
jgi:hypothetical protein